MGVLLKKPSEILDGCLISGNSVNPVVSYRVFVKLTEEVFNGDFFAVKVAELVAFSFEL